MMDMTREEIRPVEDSVQQDSDLRRLTDLQLTLIGGGIGDVIVG